MSATVTSIDRAARMHGPWWAREAPAVQAVLDLAAVDGPERRSIAALFAPKWSAELDDIARLIDGIERCGTGDPTVLDDFRDGRRFTAVEVDLACDELSDALTGEALMMAQLLASVIARAGGARS
ncbi:hypothetical protein [uncultured Jatrophihabitans sp.]|uniref:hypothetical protein n=1 Tax=uncultured Jatrophihabitans sp. TaxID=1610747 RepID=UPI0035C9FAD6